MGKGHTGSNNIHKPGANNMKKGGGGGAHNITDIGYPVTNQHVRIGTK